MERVTSRSIALVGALVLVTSVYLTYAPGLKMGFYLDDYVYLERAGHTDGSNALAQIFDPRTQTAWYRPLQAIQFLLEYRLFGGNSNVYHVVNMGFHAVNVLLLYALASRLSGRWSIGFVSALFYASFSVYASGVNWVGIVDPLVTVFYLLSFWLWWTYLEREDRLHYGLAFVCFLLALLSKQIAVTLPAMLFLAEVWLRRAPLVPARIVRRYGLFAAATGVYLLVQYGTQSTHTFAGVFGWQFGTSMAFILLQYLVLFFFPWGVFPSIDLNEVTVGDWATYAWVALALLLLAYAVWRRRSRVVVFLSAFTLLTLIPVLPFPFIEHRYLYLPILSAAIFLALLFDRVQARLGERPWFRPAAALGFALLLLGNGLAVNESSLDAAEWARQLRVPFRDIERRHATFPRDTRLYFIDPITPTTGGLAGMFLLRYGPDLSVGNWTEYAGLREHQAAFVYYFDEARRPQEVPVQKDAVTHASVPLPANYSVPLALEGYEVAQTTLTRGRPLILILYWRAHAELSRNYTVFVHLVDPSGRTVAGYDGEPRKGSAPTTKWVPLLLQSDPIVLPIGQDVPPGGGYQVQVGLYHFPTMERLSILGADGQPVTDTVTIGPFEIVEGTDGQ